MFSPVYDKKTDGCFTFGAGVSATANVCLDNNSIKEFWRGFCCQSSELEITASNELIFLIGNAAKPELDGNQYAVNIEKTGVCVVGDSEKGLINGCMTMLDLIEVKEINGENAVFEIGCGVFRENPRIKNQMAHFCIFPETGLWELERFIRFCAALKYSHVVLEFWGMLKYDCLKELGWSFAFSKEQIRPIIKTANELGLEIIPMFNHWGHASASRALHGKHVVLDQNPKFQPLFSDDGWTWNIQKPEVQELLRKIRNELIDLCGEGNYFHLGCDEAYNFEITPENHTVLTDYLNGISYELKEKGRRAIVWGDMLIAKHDWKTGNHYTANCESAELEQMIFADLDRNIVIADWQYSVREAPVETALIFKEAGFDTIICPWDRTCGDSVTPCVETAKEHQLFGVMHTTWNTLSKGMPDVLKTAFKLWSDNKNSPFEFFVTNSARFMRRVYPVNGDYEKAGWSKKQIDDIT